MRTLIDFKSICHVLGYDEDELISECDKMYRAYADYLSNVSKYHNFEHYLLINKIDME